jgi:hypothetical protein
MRKESNGKVGLNDIIISLIIIITKINKLLCVQKCWLLMSSKDSGGTHRNHWF